MHFVAGTDDGVCGGCSALHVRDEPDERCYRFGVRVVVNAVTCGTENQADFGSAQVGQRRDGSRREGAVLGDFELRCQRFDQSIQYFVARVVDHAASAWRLLLLAYCASTGVDALFSSSSWSPPNSGGGP